MWCLILFNIFVIEWTRSAATGYFFILASFIFDIILIIWWATGFKDDEYIQAGLGVLFLGATLNLWSLNFKLVAVYAFIAGINWIVIATYKWILGSTGAYYLWAIGAAVCVVDTIIYFARKKRRLCFARKRTVTSQEVIS